MIYLTPLQSMMMMRLPYEERCLYEILRSVDMIPCINEDVLGRLLDELSDVEYVCDLRSWSLMLGRPKRN